MVWRLISVIYPHYQGVHIEILHFGGSIGTASMSAQCSIAVKLKSIVKKTL